MESIGIACAGYSLNQRRKQLRLCAGAGALRDSKSKSRPACAVSHRGRRISAGYPRELEPFVLDIKVDGAVLATPLDSKVLAALPEDEDGAGVRIARASTLRPPSSVTRALTLTRMYSMPSFFVSIFVSPESLSVAFEILVIALGAKRSASPTRSPTIWLKTFASFSLGLVTADFSSLSNAARWDFRHRSQSGDVNRCTMVIEQRSRSFSEMDGSCVEIRTRTPA